MRSLALLTAVFAPTLLAAPVPKGLKVKDEVAIVGVWKLESLDTGGQKFLDAEQRAETRFWFAADGRFAFDTHTPYAGAGTFKLEPTAELKAIDFTIDKYTHPGVYELNGDTLKLCCGADRATIDRITKMKADGRGLCVWTLKRVKDERNYFDKDK